jgi:hypothetical protein
MYDLSIVTDALRDILTAALASSPLFGGNPTPFSVGLSSQHPESIVSGADCDLNLYLFHVAENKDLRNQFWTHAAISGQPPGLPKQPVAFEPLCLDLYFLLSTQSESSYQQEQQVMSIAVRAFHELPIVRLATPTPTGVATSEVTLTMQTQSVDELSRLWQALSAPLRMTAQYRAGVALLQPETGLHEQPHPKTWTLLAAPEDDVNGTPQLDGTQRRVVFEGPSGKSAYDQTPATAAPAGLAFTGQTFALRGSGIHQADDVFLVTTAPDGTETEQDVSDWKVPLVHPYPSPPSGGVPFELRPSNAPGDCPEPGRYGLRIGRASLPGWRSNTVPVNIAAFVDPGGAGPLLHPGGGGLFSFGAGNVPAGGAELRLGTVRLTRRTSGTPTAGQWRLNAGTITFLPPTGAPPDTYAVRLRVNDVESDPTFWAVVT